MVDSSPKSPASQEEHLDTNKGIIAWFARNPVAANLLMIGIILAGLNSALNIRQQMFPQGENNWVNVSAIYRGASPQEVEETITVKLEEALQSVQGIERLITRSNRGYASADLKVLDDYDVQEVLDEIRSSVDSISSFPNGMEPVRVSHTKFRQEVMYVSIAGDLSMGELKRLGETIHDELRALPDVNITDFYSGANYEISIDVSQDKLREFDLTFVEIANAVREFSTNRSAGEIRADEGVISVRVEEQAYIGAEYENIPLRNFADGSQLTLRDVARVSDGFEEGVKFSKLDGANTLTFFIGASKDQSITDISKTVNGYIVERQETLPAGIRLEPWVDLTYYLNGRLDMMLENMVWGGILVFLILAVFLRIKLAFWVMMGLPVSFLGAIALMPFGMIDVTINVVSLFAFIMVLGVVVDDAIIIGESVHTEVQEHGLSMDHVIRGAKRVAMPATFGVLTTMAAFAPMVMDSGPNAAFTLSIGAVVILCLIFSLVESKLILPAHLAAMKPENTQSTNIVARMRRWVDSKLANFIENKYKPFLDAALFHRYTVLMAFIGVIIITGAMFASGHIRFIGFPKVPHDFSSITLEMNPDAPESDLREGMQQLEAMMRKVDKDIVANYGSSMVEKILVYNQGSTQAKVEAKLVDPDLRPMDTFALSALWREAMPSIAGQKNITIADSIGGGHGQNDGDVSFRIKGRNEQQLIAAAQLIKTELNKMKGVFEVNDSEQQAAKEILFKLKPVAYSLGLTTAEVAAQTSYSLYGLEAQRIMRDRQEIRVMVRYPKSERDALSSIDNILIRTASGAEVLLSEVADLEFAEGVNQIYREEGSRAVTVWGSVDSEQAEAFKVANAMSDTVFPKVKKLYPSVVIEESGSLKDERENTRTQLIGILLILLPIYVLLALPLKSYTQPLMIMSVIPFGIMGAIHGHLLFGMDLSMPSIFGIFAVVGVVVNDSLVMVDYVNRARERGETIIDAVLHAGQKRFRAIMLTSLTTFIGLIPIMSETSLQAKIVIPMAVSLSFGVLIATLVTLVLVPCLYIIGDDMARGRKKLAIRTVTLFR
ncbi:efflux RND transporter permease subunit [Teredinibacter waterburyi]|uniref:efflux RND transporter permease subunit n=1 Tax=Teredinibacter waterburyi TaxID=1500538 RepID=UPI00165FF94C|nr:efflux RND transporter permease subunit [Teredinibacter waterburyi]